MMLDWNQYRQHLLKGIADLGHALAAFEAQEQRA